MVIKLENTLNGGFNGLYGEVVTEDVYKLKQLKFIPDVIIDLGGNVGVFSRYARSLFPTSKIISVEPDKDNILIFKQFTNDDNLILFEKGIGIGKLYKCEGAVNGAHECFINNGFGYPIDNNTAGMRVTDIDTIMPDKLIENYIKDGMKFIVKLDIEGNENIIFTHEPSMQALRKADYFTMEVHWNALTGDLRQDVQEKTFETLASFIPTHKCSLVNTMFYAIKR